MNTVKMENIKKQRDQHITKIFWLCLQISFIFAIPAVAGAILGVKLDTIYGTGRFITTVILMMMFVFSWVLVIMKYLKLQKKLKEINQAIKDNSESNI